MITANSLRFFPLITSYTPSQTASDQTRRNLATVHPSISIYLSICCALGTAQAGCTSRFIALWGALCAFNLCITFRCCVNKISIILRGQIKVYPKPDDVGNQIWISDWRFQYSSSCRWTRPQTRSMTAPISNRIDRIPDCMSYFFDVLYPMLPLSLSSLSAYASFALENSLKIDHNNRILSYDSRFRPQSYQHIRINCFIDNRKN